MNHISLVSQLLCHYSCHLHNYFEFVCAFFILLYHGSFVLLRILSNAFHKHKSTVSNLAILIIKVVSLHCLVQLNLLELKYLVILAYLRSVWKLLSVHAHTFVPSVFLLLQNSTTHIYLPYMPI